MISVNDLKTGLTLELDNGLWSVIEFLHVKPGKGAAFVKTKLKKIETGQVVERTFRAGEKVAKAQLDKKEMQYLYKEGNDFVMMDMESYEQMNIPATHIGDGVDIPNHVELTVTDTPPSERGNTSQGGTKPATLETGAVVQVPFLVMNGDVIRVDTRTNEYLGRV